MTKFYKVAAFSALLNFSIASYGQENYVCITDAVGGISYNQQSKQWDGAKFKNKNDKIIITRQQNNWKVKDFGGSYDDSFCEKIADSELVSCKRMFGHFAYHTKTKRFITTYLMGYIYGDADNKDTPYIAIGSCSLM